MKKKKTKNGQTHTMLPSGKVQSFPGQYADSPNFYSHFTTLLRIQNLRFVLKMYKLSKNIPEKK